MNLLSVLLGGLIVLSILGIIKLVSHTIKRITLEKRIDAEIESLSDWCEDISEEVSQGDSKVISITKCGKKGGCKPGGCKNCQDTKK